ncbi:MAG: DNA gyrase subunit A, partial [Oscillospiraceae bacterium]
IAFRQGCVKRRVYFDLNKKKEKLHLLRGLEKIMINIDKAIKIVRETTQEKEVIPNLMIGFGIDEIQAEFVAEIKLRHLNREYILKRTQEIEQLLEDIAQMQLILDDPRLMNKIIINELKEVSKKFGEPRKTMFIYTQDEIGEDDLEQTPDYPVNIFLTKEGYFKKITPNSLRMSAEQKLKENDEIWYQIEQTNKAELLFFTDKCQVYKSRASEFDDSKSSLMGDYIPAKLGFDPDEKIVCMVDTKDYAGEMVFFFENGKVAKVPLNAYETKTKRKKLANAYSDKSKLVLGSCQLEETEYVITATNKRKLLFDTSMINQKSTRDTIGVAVMSLKKNHFVQSVCKFDEKSFANPHRFRTKTIPAAGALLRPEDEGEQLTL